MMSQQHWSFAFSDQALVASVVVLLITAARRRSANRGDGIAASFHRGVDLSRAF
jgi:hypothetical protein